MTASVLQEKRNHYHNFEKDRFPIKKSEFYSDVILASHRLTTPPDQWKDIQSLIADNGVKKLFLDSINKIFGEQKYYNENLGDLLIETGKIFQHFNIQKERLIFKGTNHSILATGLTERIVAFLKKANVFVPSSSLLKSTSLFKYSTGTFSYCQQIALLGQGAYGTVHKAILVDTKGTRRFCAVKRPKAGYGQALAAALAAEIKKLKLVWSKIPEYVAGPVLDVFKDETSIAMVVPMAEECLLDFIAKKLPISQRIGICIELLKILQKMQKHHIMHCDLKLENALVTLENEEYKIKICDWEKMQLAQDKLRAIPPSMCYGFEADYLDANAETDQKLKAEKMFAVDYFAIAVSCYRALTAGEFPFSLIDGDVTAFKYAMPYTYYAEDLDFYPNEVQDLFKRMLDPDPGYRPPLDVAISTLQYSLTQLSHKTKSVASSTQGPAAMDTGTQ